MTSRLSKKELVLVFLLTKLNIALTSISKNIFKGYGTDEYDRVEVTLRCYLNYIHLNNPVHGT